MKYYKYKPVKTDYTTIEVVNLHEYPLYNYFEENGYKYIGVDTEDSAAFINEQPAEIEIEEVDYNSIKKQLGSCELKRKLDEIIESRIAERYTVGKELMMRDLEKNDPERIEYENFKQSIKDEIRQLKIQYGLKK